jgi:hypothetical protein
VNLERVLYGYRREGREETVLVFGQVVQPRPLKSNKPGRVRNVALLVEETLQDIQRKRRMAGG